MRHRGAGVRVGPLRSPMQCLADRMAMADGVARWRSDARGRWRHGVARRGSVSVVISSFLRLSSFFEPTGGQWATEVHRALEGDVATQHTLPRAVSTAHASAPSLPVSLSVAAVGCGATGQYRRPLILGGFAPERTRRRAPESDRSVGISFITEPNKLGIPAGLVQYLQRNSYFVYVKYRFTSTCADFFITQRCMWPGSSVGETESRGGRPDDARYQASTLGRASARSPAAHAQWHCCTECRPAEGAGSRAA